MEVALLKLLFAHLLGDFFLQPKAWVLAKEKSKLKANKLYLHVVIHVSLVFAVFLSFKVWLPALFIGVTHLLIDSSKLIFERPKTKRVWFFADQLLHLIAIVACWLLFYEHAKINFDFFNNQKIWVVSFAALFLTSPTAIIIRTVIANFIPNKSTASLQNAGMFIGVLERLLILIFVLTNHFEAVGFLLAAKSIFRFGDLKKANDIKLTEYVLIGTLLSFGIALLTALIALAIL